MGKLDGSSMMNPMIGDEAERLVADVRASHEGASAHGGKGNRRSRLWQHPLKLCIEVPYRVASAIAVMEMGISDYSVIAGAVGLTVEEVERIDMAEDSSVRLLAVAGIPAGEFFKLDNRVRCPKCKARLSIVPCIACHSF